MRYSGRVKKEYSSKNIEYYFSIECNDSELSTYLVGYGTNISSFQRDFPDDYIVCIKCRCKGLGSNRWTVTYYGANTIDFNFSIVPQKNNQSYAPGEFQFTPSMLGVRRATSADVSAGYKNMDGSDTVNNGEWMYINATDSSGGSTDYTSCPFTNDGTNLKSQAKLLLDNKMPTTVYTVHFPDSRSSTKPWLGINGVFGSDTVAPTDTTENLWIARHQTVEQVKNGIANTQYIKRVMETGPLWVGVQFLWDPTKFPLWTW